MRHFFRIHTTLPIVATVAIAFSLTAAPTASAQTGTSTLRVANWNVTTYTGAGSRDAAFQNAFYGSFQGRSFAPDILIGQEFKTQSSVNSFINILNTGLTAATGQAGDWAAAAFVGNTTSGTSDTANAFFYRTSKVEFVNQVVVSVGTLGDDAVPPRDTNRYDVRIRGDVNNTPLSLYSSHMASQSNPASRRIVEAQRIRTNAQSLPAGTSFILGGDFNITSSGSAEYQALVGSQGNNTGRFFDPINTTGSWQNDSNFRFVHTQAPGPGASAGGMDDRFDFLLTSSNLGDGVGLDYVGSFGTSYSTTTWNDPNHSYRAWGNDGSSFNTALNNTSNQMVGNSIATSLRDTATGGGHLPVFMDLRFNTAVVVPEYGTLGLLAVAAVGAFPLAVIKRRRRSQ